MVYTRITPVLVASLIAGAALAQSDLVRQVTRELDELKQTDIAVREQKLQDELRQTYEKRNKETQDIYERLNALEQSPEGKALARKREELAEKRNAEWIAERKKLAEDSKALYRQRHDELLALAGSVAVAKDLGLDVLNYPRIDGSTSTHPLSVIVASRILGTDYEWTYPAPQGSPWGTIPIKEYEAQLPNIALFGRSVVPDAEFSLAASRVMAKAPSRDKERLAKMINSFLATSANTNQAYIRLIQGKCDLNLTVRGPSADERKLASEKKVQIILTPVALDALVSMVSDKNEVESLTRDDLRSIFSGEVTDWKKFHIGGSIRPLYRERNSGSRELFDALIGGKPPEREQPPDPLGTTRPGPYFPGRKTLYARGMGGPYNALYGHPDAIGYSVWYYDHYMAMSTQTRLIPVEGIAPTRETIASGKYPLVTKIYAAYRQDEPPDSPTMKLLNWLLSPEGQSVVRESGYVPLAAN